MTLQINQSNLNWNGDIESKRGNKPVMTVLHHIEAENATVYDIHSWHLANGWMGIGYHYYVRKDGSIWTGRPEWAVGSHSPAVNAKSIGIACEGNYMNNVQMPDLQFNALVALILDIHTRYGNIPTTPHKQWTNTSCPGTYYPLARIQNAVANGTIVPSAPADIQPQTPTIVDGANAKIEIPGDFFYVRDSVGNTIPNRRVDNGDIIKVVDVSYSKQLVECWYPTPLGVRHGFITNSVSHIKYYPNNGKVTNACDTLDLNHSKIGSLGAGEQVVILEDLGDYYNVVYNTDKGDLTKSALVAKSNIQKL